jgi:hypothetical protein
VIRLRRTSGGQGRCERENVGAHGSVETILCLYIVRPVKCEGGNG